MPERSRRGGRSRGDSGSAVITATARLRQSSTQPRVQASGGVRDAGDLAALAESGVAAAISGKALLELKISTTEMEPYLQSA